MLLDELEDSPFEFSIPKDDVNKEKNSDIHSYFSNNLMTAPIDSRSMNMTFSSAAFFSKDVAHKFDTSGQGKGKVLTFS